MDRALNYASPFLTLSGVVGGFAWRSMNDIGTGFRIVKDVTLDASHPCLGGYSIGWMQSINDYMQELAKGRCEGPKGGPYNCVTGSIVELWRTAGVPLDAVMAKYAPPLLLCVPTALFLTGRGVWTHGRKDTGLVAQWTSPAGLLTIASVALTALAAGSAELQKYWGPALESSIGFSEDASGHIMMFATLSLATTLAIEAMRQCGDGNLGGTNRLLTWMASTASIFNVVAGAAQGVFLFSTTTCYHTVKEAIHGVTWLSTLGVATLGSLLAVKRRAQKP